MGCKNRHIQNGLLIGNGGMGQLMGEWGQLMEKWGNLWAIKENGV